MLRHSFASLAADLGYNEPTIASLLGHKTHSITSRTSHPADVVLLAAADAVANATMKLMAPDQARLGLRGISGVWERDAGSSPLHPCWLPDMDSRRPTLAGDLQQVANRPRQPVQLGHSEGVALANVIQGCLTLGNLMRPAPLHRPGSGGFRDARV